MPKFAFGSINHHPLVAKLNQSIQLDAADLAALSRVLSDMVVAKKAKDIIVEGFEYKVLHVVGSGYAIRYKLLHNGKRQIMNVIMPADIIGFPACFYEHAVFSVTAISEMNLHRVPLDDFADLCLARARIATALLWFAAREAAIYAEHIADAGRRAPIERLALHSGDADSTSSHWRGLSRFLRHAVVARRHRRRHRPERTSRQSHARRTEARRTDRHDRGLR